MALKGEGKKRGRLLRDVRIRFLAPEMSSPRRGRPPPPPPLERGAVAAFGNDLSPRAAAAEEAAWE